MPRAFYFQEVPFRRRESIFHFFWEIGSYVPLFFYRDPPIFYPYRYDPPRDFLDNFKRIWQIFTLGKALDLRPLEQ